MKQIALFILLVAGLSTSVEAQITRVTKTKTDSATVQTLKPKPENVYVKPPAPQADLRVSALTFSHVSTSVVDGVPTHTFQINYTITNDGNLAVDPRTVFIQGFIHRTNAPTSGACGRVLGVLPNETINPGGTLSGFFRCTAAFDRNNPPLYRLWVDYSHAHKESNEDNNMAQSTLIF